jgi:hypothetical protein
MKPEQIEILQRSLKNETHRRTRTDRFRKWPKTFAVQDKETGSWWRGDWGANELWTDAKKSQAQQKSKRVVMNRFMAMHLRSKLGRLVVRVVDTARYKPKTRAQRNARGQAAGLR